MAKRKSSKANSLPNWTFFIPVLIFLCLGSASVKATVPEYEGKKEEGVSLHKLASDLPNAQQRVHRVGLLHMCVSNWGFFGSAPGHSLYNLKESKGGCFNPNPDEEVLAPSAEYPPGSGIDYLFWGGLWIGAIVDDHPYVSVGCDGWLWIHEFWPEADESSTPELEGAIVERSTRANSSCYTTEAVSEQDIIAVYSDTSVELPLSPGNPKTDDFDKRDHFPLGLQITQQSYSWSYEYAEDFVLIDLFVKNIGVRKIKSMYMGLYIDADCGHKDENPYGNYGAQDDICGFRELVTSPQGDCSDTVNLAWIADNDGHGVDGEKIFTPVSPISVTGVRVVRSPKALDYSFNWFISNTSGAPKDWGPWKQESLEKWRDFNTCYPEVQNTFPNNVLGTPGGDCSKYFILSNGEFDYDQIFACTWAEDHPDEMWLAKSRECEDLADGYDTRYLLSFGPFDQIAPGESLIVTIGYIAGADFHKFPDNWTNPSNKTPEQIYAGFDFSDFETNATWAAKVYDNPDVNDPGKACGDGTPDFKGPPPPPSPALSFETRKGRVKVKWNGKAVEKSRDSFNNRVDFEGYRIYRSRTGAIEDYALLGSYDKKDFKIYRLNRNKESRPWEWRAASVSLDSLHSWLEGRGYEGYDYDMVIGDDPAAFTKDKPFVIEDVMYPFYIRLSDSVDVDGQLVVYDSILLTDYDSLYFEAQDWNVEFGDIVADTAYRNYVDRTSPADTSDLYWDYEYELAEFAAQSVYYAVTAFDVGDPQTGLQPLEASKLVNATLVYPVDDWAKVKEEGLKVMVYPNPYRIDGGYVENKYEKSGIREKRIRFVNLPPRCTIRIFTLDGDLVQTIDHESSAADLDATIDSWNLISRNTQAVVSGIYLFSVEDKDTGDNQVGKFVIIK
jgi:hypothetical protein